MISIELSGKEYQIKYNFNAICALEEKANKGIMELMSSTQVGFNSVRLLIWAGIKHTNKYLTLDNVGDLLNKYITEGNTLDTIMEKVSEALKESKVLGEVEENTDDLGE